MRAPMMQIHTVAAGGGSILHFDGSRYRVGPDSAGANPGPACYRRSGALCVTDANVKVGKIRHEFFPREYGSGAEAPLDEEIVREKFEALASEIERETGDNRSPVEVAEGFLMIAVENMAKAIKQISIVRGLDVSEYVLISFGGAGCQHGSSVRPEPLVWSRGSRQRDDPQRPSLHRLRRGLWRADRRRPTRPVLGPRCLRR